MATPPRSSARLVPAAVSCRTRPWRRRASADGDTTELLRTALRGEGTLADDGWMEMGGTARGEGGVVLLYRAGTGVVTSAPPIHPSIIHQRRLLRGLLVIFLGPV